MGASFRIEREPSLCDGGSVKRSIIPVILIACHCLVCDTSICENVTLSELKNVYVDYQLSVASFGGMYGALKDSEKEEYYKDLVGRLESIGFNMVEDRNDADMIVKCHFEEITRPLFSPWYATYVEVDLIEPKTGYIIHRITGRSSEFTFGGSGVPIKDMQKLIAGKIENEYHAEKYFKTSAQASTIDEGKSELIHTVFDGEIIYKGEYTASSFWEEPILPLDQLKVQGNPHSDRSIAVLVFIPNYVRGKDILEKKGVTIYKPRPLDCIANTYGYVIKYNIKNRKYSGNFMLSHKDAIVFDNYSSEEPGKKLRIGGAAVFWRDISYLLSKEIAEYFTGKGYKVIDLTPARYSLNGMSPRQILDEISQMYDISEIFIMPYEAYSKKVSTSSDSLPVFSGSYEYGGRIETVKKTAYAGLFITFKAYIYNKDDKKPLFKYYWTLSPLSPEIAEMSTSKINFFSCKKDKNGEISILKDGVVDDEWVVRKALREFSGYEEGEIEKVRIGGRLFDELSSKDH